MNTGSQILLLFDNNGAEYVSRIEDATMRQARNLGVPIRSENLYRTGRPVAECVSDVNVGAVILTPPLSDDRHVLGLLEERGLPFARIAPLLDLDRGCTVMMDEYDAARAMADLLLQAGHRRIGFVKGPKVHLVSMRRFNGYVNALGSKGLKLDHSLVVEGDFSRQSGRAVASKLFAAKPTAIFASNDEMAMGIIDAAEGAGIRIPDQISLVGFDDNAVARTSRPPLTSLRQPLEEMGEMSCKMVVDRMRKPSMPAAHETAPFRIMQRQSVKEVAPASV
jgi:LacI family transcriptional regulator